ncbi:MAG TPA: glycosyltransferase family 4 protein [Actinomycetota bacterium]|nr:glycosyltransferase family 4 protein [Actinomycetota bacterium]
MVDVLMPIHLDRWRNAISTELREIAVRVPDVSFFSFSGPETAEDAELGSGLWERENMSIASIGDVASRRFDVVHHASSTWRSIGAVAAVRLRSRRVRHIYTSSVERFSWHPHVRAEDLAVRSAHIVCAVSEAVAASIKKHYGRTVDAVIPNAVDTSFFCQLAVRPETVSRLELHRPFAVWVGTLERRKRPDVFLRLADQMPDWQFVMLGGAGPGSEGADVVRRLAGASNVRWLGLQPRGVVRDVLAAAALMVFPSETEGLPLSVLEAQAMGLPVVAQPSSSMPEIIRHDETGWLLPPHDLARWEQVIRDVGDWDPSMRQRFSEAARSAVERRFGWDANAGAYRELYLEGSRS